MQGEHWSGALAGHAVDADAAAADKKRLMLERFQVEVRRRQSSQ
jgi:hypothetical protein